MNRYLPFVLLSFIATTLCTSILNAEEILSEEQLRSRGHLRHDDFVVNSIPKCGTHLIMRCIYLMINKSVDESYDNIRKESFTTLQERKYLAFLQGLKLGASIHKTHDPYFPALENTFLQAGMKWVFMIRDPRDALVSLVFYMDTMSGNKRDFMLINAQIYNKLSFDKKIESLMTGSCCTNYLKKFYGDYIGWTRSPYGLTIKFEDLIGPRGKGTLEKQMHTVNQIAYYLNINMSEAEVRAVAEYSNIYQSPNVQYAMGRSYLQGQIGNWREHFNESNKALFKKLFGKELIELGYESNNNW